MSLPVSEFDQTQPVSEIRLIIIDDSAEYMSLLRRMIAKSLSRIEVSEYDAEQKGRPGPDFDWSLYDVVLIDHNLADGENGLDWLEALRESRDFPAAIVMASVGNEYLAARAIKLGAFDYVRKADISAEKIGRMVVDAATQTREQRVPDTQDSDRQAHLEILQRLVPERVVQSEPVCPSPNYRFVRLIGQGASSRVYLAERMDDDMTMVLKLIDLSQCRDEQMVVRFAREAEIVSKLSSPYVVRFFEHGMTERYGYIAMEFFTRGDLKHRMERGMDESDALNYLCHILLGLEAIHSARVIHRDLKPGNIMFRADDSLALADFGISKALDLASDLTNEEAVLGTPNYLSPEQAMGRIVDHRTDFYSAGIVFYEMLTGQKPYRADSASALAYQHVHAEVPRLPDSLLRYQHLVDRLLAKDRDERVGSAKEALQLVSTLSA